MTQSESEERAAALIAARTPFVEAVVVRAQRPASTAPGARAVVLADGTIEGFVGGTCARSSLRLHALRTLETDEPLLLRILPETDGAVSAEGAVTVANPCLSGGAMEIFLQPRLPAQRLVVFGDAPIAQALGSLGRVMGFEVTQVTESESVGPLDDAAVVVASHGEAEERTLERALRDHASYVGLVASRTRGAAVLAALDVDDEVAARVHTPAGLDLGARTPQESALAILAQIVSERRTLTAPEDTGSAATAPRPPAPTLVARASAPTTAVDPVCGMEVAVTAATPRSDTTGAPAWFCCDGCRERFEREASGHAAARLGSSSPERRSP